MTTGRINQVATVVGARPTSYGRTGARRHTFVRRSPRVRGARVVIARLPVKDFGTFSVQDAGTSNAHRPKPRRPRSRASVSLAFAAPVAGPEYSRRSGS